MKLTKTLIDETEPGQRDLYLWDSALAGFGVKITPAGRRVYIVQYRPKDQLGATRRYTIGPHENPWKTEAARRTASELLARIRMGEDPFADERKERLEARAAAEAERARKVTLERERFDLVVEEFVRRYAKPKNRTWAETERVLTSPDLASWMERPISSITKRDIVEVMDRVSERAPASARLLFANLRKLFNWCVGRLVLDQSPMAGLKAPELSKARDRVLSDSEIALFLRASKELDQPFGALLRILLLTAQRREEVTGMRWSELNLADAEWTIPGARTKNGQAHVVDLSPPVLTELADLKARGEKSQKRKKARSPNAAIDADLVFSTTWILPISGHSKAKVSLDEAISEIRRKANRKLSIEDSFLPAWRIHDLRRTAATGMAKLGFAPFVVEAVLNHRSGVRGGLVAVYQHYDHRPERRQALNAWSGHVVALG